MAKYDSLDFRFESDSDYEAFKEILHQVSSETVPEYSPLKKQDPLLQFSTETPQAILAIWMYLTEHKTEILAAAVAAYKIWSDQRSKNSLSISDRDGNVIAIQGAITLEYIKHLREIGKDISSENLQEFVEQKQAKIEKDAAVKSDV